MLFALSHLIWIVARHCLNLYNMPTVELGHKARFSRLLPYKNFQTSGSALLIFPPPTTVDINLPSSWCHRLHVSRGRWVTDWIINFVIGQDLLHTRCQLSQKDQVPPM